MQENRQNKTVTRRIEVEKSLFLKFRAFCIMKEKNMSSEIEGMIKKIVEP